MFEYFLSEYRAGRTPNPDILCNSEIKFRAFLDYALELGADRIATGHYARLICDERCCRLLRGTDAEKDQSYFLYALGQEQLRASLFPLGELTKTRVRTIARKVGLPNHAKKDSTGICFIGERNFREFLARYLSCAPGEIRTLDNRVIGEHVGLVHYTIGQRRGIGIGGRRGAANSAWYVVAKDMRHNVLRVVQGHDHPALFSRVLRVSNCGWISGVTPPSPMRCTVKLRHRQSDQVCTVVRTGETRWRVALERPQRAVTSGQSAVFYQGPECLGGGIISTAGAEEQL